MLQQQKTNLLKERFRGYLPVIIDVETGGLDPKKDALLEIAAVTIQMDSHGLIAINNSYHSHIKPFPHANIDKESLKINKIKPHHPFRLAIDEAEALNQLFKQLKQEQKDVACSRCILVGHNAFFDHAFVYAASNRCKLKNNPFHLFSTLDTVSLSALAYGQTVLSKCCACSGIEFDSNQAHSALYDAQCTAKLFCNIINATPQLTSLTNRIEQKAIKEH